MFTLWQKFKDLFYKPWSETAFYGYNMFFVGWSVQGCWNALISAKWGFVLFHLVFSALFLFFSRFPLKRIQQKISLADLVIKKVEG